MTREEFESILEEAFLEGYNDAMEEIFEEDMDIYTESNKETKARNRETTKRVLDREYSDEGKYDNMGLYLKYPSTTRNVERDNPHAVITKNGKVSRISSLQYNKAGYNNNRITYPRRDDLDKMMSVNKSRNKTEMDDLKDRLRDAAEMRRRLKLSQNKTAAEKYYKSRLPK